MTSAIASLEEANNVRMRVLAGEDVPAETLRACIEFLRLSRAAAPKVKAPKAPKVSKKADILAKLSGDLEGLL